MLGLRPYLPIAQKLIPNDALTSHAFNTITTLKQITPQRTKGNTYLQQRNHEKTTALIIVELFGNAPFLDIDFKIN